MTTCDVKERRNKGRGERRKKRSWKEEIKGEGKEERERGGKERRKRQEKDNGTPAWRLQLFSECQGKIREFALQIIKGLSLSGKIRARGFSWHVPAGFLGFKQLLIEDLGFKQFKETFPASCSPGIGQEIFSGFWGAQFQAFFPPLNVAPSSRALASTARTSRRTYFLRLKRGNLQTGREKAVFKEERKRLKILPLLVHGHISPLAAALWFSAHACTAYSHV